MTVTGSTSAEVAASSYVPPYKATTSYAQSPEVTGSITSALPVNPTVSSSAISGADYATAYLEAHMMSWPSYRYAYLFWIILAGLAAIYALSHHLRLSAGSLGAGYSKWGMRRKGLGTKDGRRGTILPSNNILLSIAFLIALSVVLCLVGYDYINPSSATLNFASYQKRGFVPYGISKAFWTLGNRFGYMAFAMTPLVVLFALKAPPFAFLSLRPLTHLYYDKLALFHRAAAWLVWSFTTVHTILWTIQLFRDKRDGRAVWFTIWNSYHFIFGCIAYGLMTAVMVLSLKPVRKHGFEFFYIAHVVLVFLTIQLSSSGVVREVSYDQYSYPKQNFKQNGSYSTPQRNPGNAYDDKSLPQPPSMHRSQTGDVSEFGASKSQIGYDEGSLQPLGSYDARYSNIDPTVTSPPYHERVKSVANSIPPNLPIYMPTTIPIGHAQAQLLPSRTVRLTVRVARPFHWAPGQSVLLYLPELSWFQSHPFTILNNDPNEIMLLVKARKGLTRRLFNYVRKRSLAAIGINSVKDRRISLPSMRTSSGENNLYVPPIFLKAWVDGPMGSSERVRWKDHSSVVVVCGGSGVSFGAAICEHVCMSIKNQIGKTRRIRFCWVVREYAEIAWVAGQLRRCQDMVTADQLQIDIFVTKGQRLKDDFAPPQPVFARGGTHSREGSVGSVASEMSVDSSSADRDEAVENTLKESYADVIDLTNYEDEEDVNDPAENRLSNKLEQQGKLRRARSRKIAKRKSAAKLPRTPSYPPSRFQSMYSYDNPEESYAPINLGYGHSPASSLYDPFQESRIPTVHSSIAMSPSASQSMLVHSASQSMLSNSTSFSMLPTSPPFNPHHDKRQSIRSVPDSTNTANDPFVAGSSQEHGSSSVGHSTLTDETQGAYPGDSFRDIQTALSRTSRTQSMVLLENSGADPKEDAGLWLDEADYAAMCIMSEMARAGKPKLSAVLEEEIEIALGSLIVATCGPVTLNTVVRNLVSKSISPSRIHRGDKRGHIVVYSEDYEE
ncbi:ferric-chelate reductase [Cryptococcus bacillisporus CA1873]|uniref:ferric-chelate reductase (NADPH) n=1 Tax=Cryptococcus bacillisporus CA1873 TaxID=1296111 RepID=A0ABR5B6Q9_CRYGA|nr:ferric-chelate reductase [Cryptococcus bacillisporus CA1873]|eukprot:KIR59289.1 ferric-chelate reductase [Cryptococcus gattii CA1873]